MFHRSRRRRLGCVITARWWKRGQSPNAKARLTPSCRMLRQCTPRGNAAWGVQTAHLKEKAPFPGRGRLLLVMLALSAAPPLHPRQRRADRHRVLLEAREPSSDSARHAGVMAAGRDRLRSRQVPHLAEAGDLHQLIVAPDGSGRKRPVGHRRQHSSWRTTSGLDTRQTRRHPLRCPRRSW